MSHQATLFQTAYWSLAASGLVAALNTWQADAVFQTIFMFRVP